MANIKLVSLFIRIGIAFTFFYTATQTILHPDDWIWFFPAIMRNTIPHSFLLTGFPIYEAILGIWLLTGWRLLFSSSLAALTMFGIIFSNFTDMDIVFRDVSIFFSTAALAIGSYQMKKKK